MEHYSRINCFSSSVKLLSHNIASKMMQINITLMSGHTQPFTLLPSCTVEDIRQKCEQAFGKKYFKFITAKNRVLVNSEKTLEEAEIENGEWLTTVVLEPQLATTQSCAFAFCCHSSVLTWGHAEYGGNSSAAQDELKAVNNIQSTGKARSANSSVGTVESFRNVWPSNQTKTCSRRSGRAYWQ